MKEWKQYKLIDILDKVIDYRGKTPQKTESGIPLITAKIIKDGRILPPNEFIAENNYEKWMVRGIPQEGDVVLTVEAPLGEVAQLDNRKIALAQRVVTLRGKKGVLDNTYLKYFLMSNIGQARLKARETGTTVTGIKQSELREVLIDCPDYTTQIKIASILNAIDAKIELNRQINDNLEQQLQALYNEWFLENPKSDWHSVNLSEIATFVSGYSYKGNELMENSDTAMATIKNFERNGGFKIDGYKPIIPSAKLKVDQRARLFDILVAHTDLTQNAEVIGNAEILLSKDIYKDLIFSMDLVKVNAKESFPFQFLLALLLKNSRFKSHCIGYVNGTTVLHMNKRALPDYETIIPNLEDAQNINATAKAIFCQMSENLTEISNLTKMRDTLLPKLMSGELKINEIDC